MHGGLSDSSQEIIYEWLNKKIKYELLTRKEPSLIIIFLSINASIFPMQSGKAIRKGGSCLGCYWRADPGKGSLANCTFLSWVSLDYRVKLTFCAVINQHPILAKEVGKEGIHLHLNETCLKLVIIQANRTEADWEIPWWWSNLWSSFNHVFVLTELKVCMRHILNLKWNGKPSFGGLEGEEGSGSNALHTTATISN